MEQMQWTIPSNTCPTSPATVQSSELSCKHCQCFNCFNLDYDAPLSEAGDYTEKYEIIQKLIAPALAFRGWVPERPAESVKKAYPSLRIESYLSFTRLVDQVVISMTESIKYLLYSFYACSRKQ